MLALCRNAIAARKRHFADGDDALVMIDMGPDVLAYERSSSKGDGDVVTVVVNMSGRPIPLPDGDVIVSSAPETLAGLIPTDAAVWVSSR